MTILFRVLSAVPSSVVFHFYALCLLLFLPRGIFEPKNQVGFACTNISNPDEYGCNLKNGKLRIFVVADTGGKEDTNGKYGPTDGQRSVAKLMKQLANEKGLNLVLNLGDNFYENGVTEANVEERFKTNFLDVFGTVGLETVPWYTIAGNRDYKSAGQLEAAISPQIMKTSGKWTFPDYYYTIHYNFGTNLKVRAIQVRFVMIDTVILCGQNRKAFRDPHIVTDEMTEASEKHFKWLERELELAGDHGVDFVFVAGHYPLYLIDGPRSFTCAQGLQTLLSHYGVSAYFSGHEHNLKYLAIDGDVPRIVSGAGSRMESATDEMHIPKESKVQLQFGYPDSINVTDEAKSTENEYIGGGFVAMEIDEKTMEAKINFYAAGHLYPTKREFASKSNNEFKYSVKLKKIEGIVP